MATADDILAQLGINPQDYNLPVQPGIQSQEDLIKLAVQKYIAELTHGENVAQLEQNRRQWETGLAANPADFVAYELYKRKAQEAGLPTVGKVRPNTELQGAYNTAVGLPHYSAKDALAALSQGNTGLANQVERFIAGGGNQVPGGRLGPAGPNDVPMGATPPGWAGQGVGQFGVTIPRPGDISHSAFTQMSDTDKGILGSFLNAGVKNSTGGFTALDPNEFYQKQQQGFVPAFAYQGPNRVSV